MIAGSEDSLVRLEPYQPRQFVPDDADLGDRDTVIALYQKLLERPMETPAELERWLLDRSELSAAVGQHGAILYIRMTCQTDDQTRADAYKAFVETIEPALKEMSNRLDSRYLSLREAIALPADRYFVYDRGLRADVELFREENVPLQTQESLLSQQYQTVCGAMTVDFRGQERTLQEMSKFLLEPDRPLREEAWRATAARRLQDRDTLEDLLDRMTTLRAQIAANADCDGYCDYKFRDYHRFDYTPEDCLAYHQAVETEVAPLMAVIHQRRRDRMGVPRLCPWDTAVDPLGRAPLHPFETVDQLVSGCQEIFLRVDPQLGGQFRMMAENNLLDLASRKGKAPGGYQYTLNEARKPFIFMNAVGIDDNVRTLLHEGGHAFHALASAAEPLAAYRHAPMEFCEVASMSMELLAGDHLDVFYDADSLRRSRREHLEGCIAILPWVATIDAFQHWLYANPQHTREERAAAWRHTFRRFASGEIDYAGLEEEETYLWHRQLHIFEVPFYYIEYGIAQLGALQLWVKARQDPAAALEGYKRALALGGSRPLPELFAAAGLRFDFSAETISPLVAAVREELDALEE